MNSFVMVCQSGSLKAKRVTEACSMGEKESYPGYLGLVPKALGKEMVMRP